MVQITFVGNTVLYCNIMWCNFKIHQKLTINTVSNVKGTGTCKKEAKDASV